MTVINEAMVSHHVNWLYTRVENDDTAPFTPVYAAEAYSAPSGLVGRFWAQDTDGVIWEITVRPSAP